MSVELKIDGVSVGDEERVHIANEQAEHDREKAARDAVKLEELQQRDRGNSERLLSADKSGLFAQLVHRDSFFIADEPESGQHQDAS